MQNKIYIPSLDYNYCYIYNSDTIRCFENNIPDIETNYRDYYINSHYISKNGVRRYSRDLELIPEQQLTNDFYYRNDLSDILICFVIIAFVGFVIPLKVITRLFKRFSW